MNAKYRQQWISLTLLGGIVLMLVACGQAGAISSTPILT
jgi:hypothetical protein